MVCTAAVTSRKPGECQDKGREMGPSHNPVFPWIAYRSESLVLFWDTLCPTNTCCPAMCTHRHLCSKQRRWFRKICSNTEEACQHIWMKYWHERKKGQNKASKYESVIWGNASKHPDCDKLTRKSWLRMNWGQKIVWQRANEPAVRHSDFKFWKATKV